MTREQYKRPPICLIGDAQKETACAAIMNAPIDTKRPLEVLIREKPKTRTLDQNALMWAGQLKDISQQVWVNNRTYSTEVWHELFKKDYLPEVDDVDIDLKVKNVETYKKWDFDPNGERVCVGSTTELSKAGFAEYLTQIEVFGAEHGVQFTAKGGLYKMIGAA